MVKYPIALLLGAGASKPLGIPTTEEMAKEFLETTPNTNLKSLPLVGRQDLDIEEVIRVVQNVKRLVNNEGLEFVKQFDDKVIGTIIGLSNEFDVTEKELFNFIREKCLSPDTAKAKEIYEPLLALRERANLKIFTTNYDIAIESVCKELKIEYRDGFKWSSFEEYPIFDPSTLETGDVQLYKMHGSVNWWSDNSRQTIARLSLDLQGARGVTNLMIYPAQKEDIFNYPFNIYQSILIRTLHEVEELIAIGHRFRDINIASAVHVALERSNFKLTIISPSATTVKEGIFKNHQRVNAINAKIEDCMTTLVEGLMNRASEYNTRKEQEDRREYEAVRQKIIHEYEREVLRKKESESRVPLTNLLALNELVKNVGVSNEALQALKNFVGPQRKLNCPKCQHEFMAPMSLLTIEAQCPKCKTTFTMK